ncbi:hypothetical protein [Nitrospira moscoviensis]|uniref:Uncharacterized protein n=1 Tax=Nitrospira moscoviensis TaxID=42253 RepID=A0A0K2GCG1_NITMO|nr:hypothetical protein [Nitrospira moscoviensis]ALA58645.1 hypothetical protein NITMOv2_2229 [Nitrospira moscoviensis]
MNCPRCQGLLLRQTFSDFFRVFHAWRCFNCGAMIDRIIAANRREQVMATVRADKLTRRWVRRAPISVSQ